MLVKTVFLGKNPLIINEFLFLKGNILRTPFSFFLLKILCILCEKFMSYLKLKSVVGNYLSRILKNFLIFIDGTKEIDFVIRVSCLYIKYVSPYGKIMLLKRLVLCSSEKLFSLVGNVVSWLLRSIFDGQAIMH